MTWSEYVARTCGDDQGKDFQAKTGIDGSTLSRWKRGDIGGAGGLRVDKVAAFARGYRRPVLEAFIEAGFLTTEEAKARPAGKPNLAEITNDELIELVRRRLAEAGEEHARSAPIGAARTVGGLRKELEERLARAATAAESAKVEQLLADLDRAEQAVVDTGEASAS